MITRAFDCQSAVLDRRSDVPVEDCRLAVESSCYYNKILRSENVLETLLVLKLFTTFIVVAAIGFTHT